MEIMIKNKNINMKWNKERFLKNMKMIIIGFCLGAIFTVLVYLSFIAGGR